MLKKISRYDFITLILFFYSLYIKLNKLNLIEYKYDQQFGFSVLRNCSDNNYFSYIKGSTGIPQGALHYVFECLGGVFGINNFITLVKFDIVISQISLYLIYLLISKNINKFVAASSISLVLFNPYLLISTRNISSAQHFEFFFLIFLFLFFNLKNLKNGKLILSFFTSISFIIYFPLYIYFSSFLFVIFIMDKNRKTYQYIFGYLIGLIVNLLSYFPYFNEFGFPTTRNTTSSWGISSYWRIYLDIFSSSSLKIKINNPSDFNDFLDNYPHIDELFFINKIILFIMMTYFIFHYVLKIYKKSVKIDLSLLNFTAITLSGVIFLFLNRPLYAHYFFAIIILGYVTFIQVIPKKILVIIICMVLNFSNILIYNNFLMFVEENNGIQNSDYGKIYSECGCCVDDARTCRGQ